MGRSKECPDHRKGCCLGQFFCLDPRPCPPLCTPYLIPNSRLIRALWIMPQAWIFFTQICRSSALHLKSWSLSTSHWTTTLWCHSSFHPHSPLISMCEYFIPTPPPTAHHYPWAFHVPLICHPFKQFIAYLPAHLASSPDPLTRLLSKGDNLALNFLNKIIWTVTEDKEFEEKKMREIWTYLE